jgi:hypothetical protein
MKRRVYSGLGDVAVKAAEGELRPEKEVVNHERKKGDQNKPAIEENVQGSVVDRARWAPWWFGCFVAPWERKLFLHSTE